MFRNKLSVFEACYIIVSQILGALAAGYFCFILYDSNWDNVGYPTITGSYRAAFIAELVQTFALVLTVLNTATTTAQANNSYFGVAIGFVVLSGALAAGSVSGACFNPAVAMLAALHHDFSGFFVYFFGPTSGAILAALFFRIQNPLEFQDLSLSSAISKGHHNPEGRLSRAISMLSCEFIGTMLLVYTIALSINDDRASQSLGIGFMLVSLVYMGGAVSGAHFNPAVTLGVYIKGFFTLNGMRFEDCLLYILFQIMGGFTGGYLASAVNGGNPEDIAGPSVDNTHHTQTAAYLAEFIFSFLLVLCVLCSATTSASAGNSYFGLAIGFVVLSGISTVGDISGAALNPAVGISLGLIRGNPVEDIYVYVLGPLTGSVGAAAAYLFWHRKNELQNYEVIA